MQPPVDPVLLAAEILEEIGGGDLARLAEHLMAASSPRALEHALRADPGSSPVRLNLALTLSLLGRNAEAMEHYREARRLNPALPDLTW